MRFTVRFRKYEGEFRTIIAHLSAREVESVEALRKFKGTQTANDAAAAYAFACGLPRSADRLRSHSAAGIGRGMTAAAT